MAKMWKTVRRVALWLVLALLALLAITVARNWDLVQRLFLGGVKVYETTPPAVPANIPRPAILVFSKTNAFRHEEAIPAGKALFKAMAAEHGWGYFETENAAAFSPAILARFDAVVFNNSSGDVFLPAQRKALRDWLEAGGGYVGLHASGDSSQEKWAWYVNDLIGARFTAHTMKPQFQTATYHVEGGPHPATAALPAQWNRIEEIYSFEKSPRKPGATVLVTVDEKTYQPVGMFGKDLRMGADHPMVWWHCAGKGRVLYSAMGHRAEAFAEPEHKALLTGAIEWAMRAKGEGCDAGAVGATPAR